MTSVQAVEDAIASCIPR